MFDTSPEGLLDLIRHGESETVEFKEYLPPDSVVARDLTAFANTSGGILIVGVNDRGQVTGLPAAEAARTTEALKRVSSSLCPWSTDMGAADLHGKRVAFLVVGPAPPHLSPAMTSQGRAFKRQGTHDVELSPTAQLDIVRRDRGRDSDHDARHGPDEPCRVFVAMSFQEEHEPALVDYFNAMRRAAERTGLGIELWKMDLMEGDYEISQKIMEDIERADVVIADLTLGSANVYFELGYARASKRRVIQTARKDTLLPFDVRNWRTIVYRNATELEEKLGLELAAAHRDVMGPAAP